MDLQMSLLTDILTLFDPQQMVNPSLSTDPLLSIPRTSQTTDGHAHQPRNTINATVAELVFKAFQHFKQN